MKISRQSVIRIFAVVLVLCVSLVAIAQNAPAGAGPSLPIPSVKIGMEGQSGDQLSSSLQILALLTILSIAPAIMILTTAFTRIVIILSLARTAIGAQNIPPNQVIVGLSLFLTFYVMGPTYNKINEVSVKPYMQKKVSSQQAIDAAQTPLREFMLKNTYNKDLKLFLDLRKEKATAKDVSLSALVPAFVLSELKTAFVVGLYIFIPFVIIDLIVASMLMSLGMMMMPPTVVALPAKLLVFVLADGWSLLATSILSGYR